MPAYVLMVIHPLTVSHAATATTAGPTAPTSPSQRHQHVDQWGEQATHPGLALDRRRVVGGHLQATGQVRRESVARSVQHIVIVVRVASVVFHI